MRCKSVAPCLEKLPVCYCHLFILKIASCTGHDYLCNTSQMHPQHVRACFPSYDYHRLCPLVQPSTASRAEVWFSQLLFCMAWFFNSFRFYFIDTLILLYFCPYSWNASAWPCKVFPWKGNPTGWAIRIRGCYFNFRVSFTQKSRLTWRDSLRIFIDYNSDLQMLIS